MKDTEEWKLTGAHGLKCDDLVMSQAAASLGQMPSFPGA